MNDLRVPDFFGLEPFPSSLRELLRPWGNEAQAQAQAPQIKIDVSENDEAYTVKAEIPGVRKEDIDVRIDGSRITIAAEIKQEKDEKKGDRLLRSERRYGYASRSFALASDVDDAHAVARYANGVLELQLPKRAVKAQQRLTIS